MAEKEESSEPLQALPPQALVPLTRRAHMAPERAAIPPEIAEQFDHLTHAVQVLSAHFVGEPPAASSETLKERAAKRVKKFQRAGGEERGGQGSTEEENPSGTAPDGGTTAIGDEPADPLALNKHIAWPRLAPSGKGAGSGERSTHWWQRRPSTGTLLGAQALGLVLLVIGFLLGHYSTIFTRGSESKNRRHGADLFGQPELTEQALQTANEGLHAEHTGDAEGARKIYEKALNKRVELYGLNYRLALLAIQRNDRLEAEQRLERSASEGEYLADCCYVLARLAADKGDFDEMANQFQRAARSRPFTGKYFFFLGEAMRRQGKPQAAVTAFEQALDRSYTAESGDLYLFKERLAKVEYGHDEAFNAELANHLKQTPVAGEWMLLAAAQELDHQAYAEAAEHLRLAGESLPAAIYSSYTHDYFFRGYAKRSEVMSLLNRVPPLVISSAGPTVLDPASWSPDRADPATWPSASGNQPDR